MLSSCFSDFSVDVAAFVIGQSQICSLFSLCTYQVKYICFLKYNLLDYKIIQSKIKNNDCRSTKYPGIQYSTCNWQSRHKVFTYCFVEDICLTKNNVKG